MIHIDETAEVYSSPGRQIIPARVACAAGAVMCLCAIGYTSILAYAGWLRRNPEEQNVRRAIQLDPHNSYAYTLRAEWQERAGQFQDAEASWEQAVSHNRRDAESRIRSGLLAEQRGNLELAEERLLAASRFSQKWFPRWVLVNFYARHRRQKDVIHWAKLAMERASEEWVALLPLLEESGVSPDAVLERVLPANRAVLETFLAKLLESGKLPGVEKAAKKLLSLIPDSPPGWPGTNVWRPPSRYEATDGEIRLLHRTVRHLLETSEGDGATGVWNAMNQRGIISSGVWTNDKPMVNSQFRTMPVAAGLDWRAHNVEGAHVDFRPSAGELAVRLSGRQPDPIDIVEQAVYLPANQAYRMQVEFRTEGLGDANGLHWRLLGPAEQINLPVSPSVNWVCFVVTVPASKKPQTGRLVLTSRRIAGSVRAEGEVRFRLVSLEAIP